MNRFEDPNDELNSPKYYTGKTCIGGIVGECDRPAGTAWSELWCHECNVVRMRRIDASLREIEKASEAMISPPKTIEEAREYRYGKWVGNPNGDRYIQRKCAYEIMRGFISYQCSRDVVNSGVRYGEGPGDLYCKQHAKKVKP